MATSDPIFFVTTEPARAVGFNEVFDNFHLVALRSDSLTDELGKRGVNVFCLNKEIAENSGLLLEQQEVADYIATNSSGEPKILYFKPSPKIDRICLAQGYKKLGNGHDTGEKFENKVSFFNFCLKNNLPTPPGVTGALAVLEYKKLTNSLGKSLVIQFERGWAGNTTYFVGRKDQFNQLKSKFGKRDVRVGKLIGGKTYLNNCCIYADQVLVSRPATQINNLAGVKTKSGATYGRKWPSGLSVKVEEKIKNLSVKVGKLMSKEGYKGWFGLDFIVDSNNNVYLAECNARLTASISFYTQNEILQGITRPLIYWHATAFLGAEQKAEWEDARFSGSQMVVRNESEKTVKAKKRKSGVYKITGGKAVFSREGLGIGDLTSDNEIYVRYSEKPIVKPGSEMVSVEARSDVDDIKFVYAE